MIHRHHEDSVQAIRPRADVLVVGGGLVGLSAALFLAWQGISTVLVERHAGSSAHPRAIGYTPRTLELLRAVGLADRIPTVPDGFRLRRARVESLAGRWIDESAWTPGQEDGPSKHLSPTRGAAIAQDRLEPMLRERAIELGADVRLSTELVALDSYRDGVVATLRTRDGEEYRLAAQYVVAADGHRSPLRTALGIERSGRGPMRVVRSVLFRAPLEEYLARGVSQFQIEQEGFSAFLTTYGDGRWVLMFTDDVDRDESVLRDSIARSIGRDDVPIEIVTTGRWEMAALIADRFSEGRVFLAGDAAHMLPPTRGGYGANTGIDDAHNLAWKLAAVVKGESQASLLETYDAERRPVAWLRHDQTFARDDYKRFAGDAAKTTTILDDDAMEFGQLYRSTSVLGADASLPPAARPDVWRGQPGTRAPHVWLSSGERPDDRSSLDLLQRRWVLVAGDARWESAARAMRDRAGVTVDFVPLAHDAWREALRLDTDGAALIRPDGYIAWRAMRVEADPIESLAAVVRTVAHTR